MSSFRKRNVQKPIPGTRTSLQTGQIITSTGNSSLDAVLGGGLPIGSLTLIEEDKYTTHSKVLTKYFLAEGIASQQSIFFGSLDDDPAEFIKKLPKPLDDEENEKIKIKEENPNNPSDQKFVDDAGAGGDKNGLRIAWRYNDLLPVNSEQATTKIGHQFDLSEQIDDMSLMFAETFLWNDSTKDEISEKDTFSGLYQSQDSDESIGDQQKTNPPMSEQINFNCVKYQRLLNKLSITFSEGKFNEDATNSPKALCRICISSLGSPLWYDDHFTKDILKFLTILRALVRNINSVCFITMPMHLISKYDANLTSKIRNLVDFSIELESFAGSDDDTNPAFKEYSGLIHLRMSAINTLSVYKPNTSDLAFKLRRKKFVIEKLHLPPELGIIQAEDKLSIPASCCGSTENSINPLDF